MAEVKEVVEPVASFAGREDYIMSVKLVLASALRLAAAAAAACFCSFAIVGLPPLFDQRVFILYAYSTRTKLYSTCTVTAVKRRRYFGNRSEFQDLLYCYRTIRVPDA